jgi:hypothetical protein
LIELTNLRISVFWSQWPIHCFHRFCRIVPMMKEGFEAAQRPCPERNEVLVPTQSGVRSYVKLRAPW